MVHWSRQKSIKKGNPGFKSKSGIFSFILFFPLPLFLFILQSLLPSILTFSPPLFFLSLSPIFSPLFILTLFIATNQINYIKINSPIEFQLLAIPFSIITLCPQNNQTFLKNQLECFMRTYELNLFESRTRCRNAVLSGFYYASC